MQQIKLDRINELARLSRERELDNDEKAEQLELRKAYIDSYRNSMKSQLDRMVIVDKNGRKTHVKDMQNDKN